MLIRITWTIALTLLLLIATYVSIGRILLPQLNQHQNVVESWLSTSLNMQVSIDGITGSWKNFSPGIALHGVQLSTNNAVKDSVQLGNVELLLDVPASLWNRSVVFSFIKIANTKLSIQKNAVGSLVVNGLKLEAKDNGHTPPETWLKMLMRQQNILLQDIQLKFIFNTMQIETLVISTAVIHCEQLKCAAKTDITITKSNITKMAHLVVKVSHTKHSQKFNVNAYAQWDSIVLDNWLPLINKKLSPKLRIHNSKIGGKVWLNITQNQVVQVNGELSLPKLKILSSEQQPQTFTDISTHFNWLKPAHVANNNWSLKLHQLEFIWQNQHLSPTNINIINNQAEGVLSIALDNIDLAIATTSLLAVDNIPKNIKDIIKTINPIGSITNAKFIYPLSIKASLASAVKSKIKLIANLNNVAVSAWKHAPAISGVNGYLEITPSSGQVIFNSAEVMINFPKLYSNGWNFKYASGLISWQNQGKSLWLEGSNLKLKTDATIVNGDFSLWQPDLNIENYLEPRLDLELAIEQSTIKEALSFIPDRKLNPNLISWLNNGVLSGTLSDTAFIYSGSISKNVPLAQQTILMHANTKQLDLLYHQDWPPLSNANATIMLFDQDVVIEVDQAAILSSNIDEITASYNGVNKTLYINTQLNSSMKDLLYTMQHTPIRASLFNLVDDFEASGAINVSMTLELPLKNLLHAQADIHVVMDDTNFAIPSLNLAFENIEGNVAYSTKNGLIGKKIKGEFLDHTFMATINSIPQQDNVKLHHTNIDIQGTMDSKSLYNWQKIPVLSRLNGASNYKAQISLGTNNDFIRINTDLVGMQVKLPAPYGKASEAKVPLTLTMGLKSEPVHKLQYGELIQYALKFNNNTYTNGQIVLGDTLPTFIDQPNIYITGNTPTINYNEWQVLIQDLIQEIQNNTINDQQKSLEKLPKTASTLEYLKQIKLNAKLLNFYGQELNDVNLTIDHFANDWTIHLNNKVVKGLINISDNPKILSNIKFDYLWLPKATDINTDALVSVIPQQLMAMNITIADLKIGGENYGNWGFNLQPTDTGAKISKLAATVRDINILGDINWTYIDDQHMTEFSGVMQSNNIGKALQSWEYPPSIEAKTSKIKGTLSWLGSPINLSLTQLKGNFTWKAKQGRLVELNGITDAMRVLGIMNLKALSRRLRLDFSDLFKKGYSFDNLAGSFNINNGFLKITEPLIVNGPSAKFMLDGTTNINTQTLDQQLIVVLPLSENIPIAAAIIGAPQVGIPLYILHKAFGNMFERFTSVRYNISGNWDAPDIDLVRVFSNKTGTIKEASNHNKINAEPN